METKHIYLPSTLEVGIPALDNVFNFNKFFWEYILSENFLKVLFKLYMSQSELEKDSLLFNDFILKNIKKIKTIINDSFIYPYGVKGTFYYFKILLYITGILNLLYDTYSFSLPYGIQLRDVLKNYENHIFDEVDFVVEFYNSAIAENSAYFKNDTAYAIYVKWESQLYHVMLFSSIIKRKYKNVKIFLDLSMANEQTDFSPWLNLEHLNKYVDNIKNLYLEIEETENKGIHNTVKLSSYNISNKYGVSRVITRLFNTKCYWNKCSFCTINFHHKSLGTINTLDPVIKRKIDDFILFLKKQNKLILLTLTDEAIEQSILIYFAEQIINHEIDIHRSARIRFSDKFTSATCSLLAKSGLKFVGVGLESINQRVITLMNKREREYSKNEINEILNNFYINKINPHLYLILGFPSETKAETDETVAFVREHLYKNNYFTFSANRFYLMKGSEIYNNAEKYNITITDKNKDIKLSDIEYVDNSLGSRYTKREIIDITLELYAEMFFPHVDDKEQIQVGYTFWDYLDRTGLFYEYKLLYDKNPFWDSGKETIEHLDENILNTRYKLFPLMDFGINSKEYLNLLTDEIITIYADINKKFYTFINNYNIDLTLKENLLNSGMLCDRMTEKYKEKIYDIVLSLINDSILYKIQEKLDF